MLKLLSWVQRITFIISSKKCYTFSSAQKYITNIIYIYFIFYLNFISKRSEEAICFAALVHVWFFVFVFGKHFRRWQKRSKSFLSIVSKGNWKQMVFYYVFFRVNSQKFLQARVITPLKISKTFFAETQFTVSSTRNKIHFRFKTNT